MTSLFPELQLRDWNDDPLHQTWRDLSQLQEKVDPNTSAALHAWFVFHGSTRLKLEAAEYHSKTLWHIERPPRDE
ncbi:MAG TPA: hypothetical protein VJM51_00290 [Dehalococcoidia bacterium]|nr:hypothetical protein [Dehalococcoidia bacterium]